MLPVYLGGISSNIEYQYDMNQGLLLALLSTDQVVDPCFDGVDVLCSGCAS